MTEIKGVKMFEWTQISEAEDGTQMFIMWATHDAFATVTGKDEKVSSWRVNMTDYINLATGTSVHLRAAKRHAEAVLISEYHDKAKEAGVTE